MTLITTIQEEVLKLSSPPASRRDTPIQPWITPALLRSINKRNHLLKTFLKHRTIENENKYRRYKNTLRLSLRHAKKNYYQKQFTKNAMKPRLLWADLLEAIKLKKSTANHQTNFEVNGNLTDNPNQITESFNQYYTEVAPKLDSALGPCTTDPLSYMADVAAPEMFVFDPVSHDYISLLIRGLKDTGAGLTKLTRGF